MKLACSADRFEELHAFFEDVGRQARIIVSWQDLADAFKLVELPVRVVQGNRIGAGIVGIDRAAINDVSGNESPTTSLEEANASRTVAWGM